MGSLWKRFQHLAALLIVSAGLAWSYVVNHNLVVFWQQNLGRFHAFLSKTAGCPEQYRFVQYWLAHGFGLLFPDASIYVVIWLAYWATFFSVFLAAWHYYRAAGVRMIWLSLALLAGTISYTLTKSHYSAGSYLEIALYMGGILAVLRRDPKWLLPLSLVGALNRETIVFLPLLSLAYTWRDKRRWWSIGSVAAAIAVYFAVRWTFPQTFWTPCREGLLPGLGLLWRNLTDLEGIVFVIGFLGFMPLAWNYWPKHLWPWLLMIPTQVVLWLYFGNTIETRLLLLPVALIVVPACCIPRPITQASPIILVKHQRQVLKHFRRRK